MKLNIKDAAQERLATKIPAGSVVLLSVDDGSNKYSTVGGSCAIGDKFQLVILNQRDPDYPIEVENNAGLNLWTSTGETTYFDNGLTLNFRGNNLVLSDDGGILDSAVSINDYRDKQPLTREDREAQMKTLGNQIC
ncbi:iron-sulfur cluster biosynthesis family protein [Levilactobacillus bambusae]|uniref:Core domain-containing protein n=1 Tax=Levilactobacillus bambusae TaxID=2024736 RepID=A0A2V1N0J7_9LACO|nr:iron-sulfur cluster biosynthesis family protein [Levilactobacillus bambusae]PWG00757.1 hypothetical protein DCM90_00850 [Levilactobacillus bambusae]